MAQLRVQYSSTTESSYEFIKVSTPRAGVGLSMTALDEDNDCSKSPADDTKLSCTGQKHSMPCSRP